METISQQAARLHSEWETNSRWSDTERAYSAEDVVRLRGTVTEEFTLARRGAERLRKLLAEEDAVTASSSASSLRSRSAPRRASVNSSVTDPRSRTTSWAE